MFPLHSMKKYGEEIFPVNYESVVISGVAEYDVLCPVSKLTGHRENPISLLSSLINDPQKSRQLAAFLQELPSLDNTKGLTDEDMVDLMMDRLSTGTPAEDERYRSMLESVAGDLLRSVGFSNSEPSVESNETIKFDGSDGTSVE